MTEQVGSLMKITLAMLAGTNQSLMEISRTTGLSLYWLQSIRANKVVDPSVNNIQKLYEHLAQKELKV